MAVNEINVEKALCDDAAKIVIDEKFKYDLKKRILFGDKYNNVIELPKHKNNFIKNKYFKIASGLVICVFVGGTIFRAINVPSKNIFTKADGNTDVIMPIVNAKGLTGVSSEKINPLQRLDDIIKNNYKTKQTNLAIKNSKSADSKALAENGDNNNVIIKKDTNGENYAESDASINQGLSIKGTTHASAPTVVKVPIDVPDKGNVKDDTSDNLKVYDSRYSFDEKKLVSVKDDGIYVKNIGSSIETKLIACNAATQIVDKPNFTPKGEIIYYKAEKVKLENGAIYLSDKNGKNPIKIVDGKSPMISKDGVKLAYEVNGSIYIENLLTKARSFIANGKYPAFSDNGNLISYVKEGTISSLYVFNTSTGKENKLSNMEISAGDSSIQSWAAAVRSVNGISNLSVTGKYSYFESIWCSSNKEIYVLRRNNPAQVFDLIKFKVDL
ncbi:MAG TPA: hypothetical protein VIM70_13390 [Clostridium sp.]|uniref:hypothetical protein n=1 Tax=Clostridium sp. TaxID=1506 RepID=UPI002F94F58E